LQLALHAVHLLLLQTITIYINNLAQHFLCKIIQAAVILFNLSKPDFASKKHIEMESYNLRVSTMKVMSFGVFRFYTICHPDDKNNSI
jgi:hypothetical protein